MEVNKKTIILLVVILLVLVIAIFFVVKNGNQEGTTKKVFFQKEEEIIKVSEEDYQRELKQAINSLMAEPANPAVVNSVKERILDLSVPGEYRQLHLDLVLAIAHLENENGTTEKLEEIILNNEWLK